MLRDNIIGTRNVFEAARLAGVAKVVFASSNHVVGGYEVEAGAQLYALKDRRVYSESSEVRPDSLYGASKVFGEALGRMYSDQYGIKVVCLRLGTVLGDDDPRSARIPELIRWPALAPKDRLRRVRATWLSHRENRPLNFASEDGLREKSHIQAQNMDPSTGYSIDGGGTAHHGVVECVANG